MILLEIVYLLKFSVIVKVQPLAFRQEIPGSNPIAAPKPCDVNPFFGYLSTSGLLTQPPARFPCCRQLVQPLAVLQSFSAIAE